MKLFILLSLLCGYSSTQLQARLLKITNKISGAPIQVHFTLADNRSIDDNSEGYDQGIIEYGQTKRYATDGCNLFGSLVGAVDVKLPSYPEPKPVDMIHHAVGLDVNHITIEGNHAPDARSINNLKIDNNWIPNLDINVCASKFG